VHQGGAGTTAQVLRAGKPMIVVPYSHDQPDNAMRVGRLGVARTIPRGKYRAPRIAPELGLLFSAKSYRESAARAAAVVAAEDGVATACAGLEELLGGRRQRPA